ncbi:BEM_HP_G0080000.mRNA.1.CDS.1 [Saccharomyces cerevisiae]|nr:BEM_HP_G0080000.mRNA.1.CDS.1 [Saccharomyces cerevisiae]CAI6991821.1 BEM_HP_G0080000.mRNA.1.CDS.1 [Saccharomyces cerevisiae]
MIGPRKHIPCDLPPADRSSIALQIGMIQTILVMDIHGFMKIFTQTSVEYIQQTFPPCLLTRLSWNDTIIP